MNMPSKKSAISLALGFAFAAMLGTALVASASENPFVGQSLEKGCYMMADSHRYLDKGGYEHNKDGYDEKRGDKKYRESRRGMSMADTDNDDRVSREEHARHAAKMFEKMDTNKDGYIDGDEARAMNKRYRHGGMHGDSYKSDRDRYGDLPMQREREDDPPESQ